MNYVSLHNLTHFSLLDATTRPKYLAQFAKDNNMPAIAITDNAAMYGACKFYDECKKQGVKAIIGANMFLCDDMTIKDVSNRTACNLVLLAKNKTGYLNLMQLITKAHLDGFYYKPRIDYKLLKEFSEGLICLSGDLTSDISRSLLADNFDRGLEYANLLKDIFADDFYLEVLPPTNLPKQEKINEGVFKISNEIDVKVVCASNSHYFLESDKDAFDILVCIQNGDFITNPERFKYEGELYNYTYEELKVIFKDNLDCLSNTLEVADKCTFEIEYNLDLLPRFDCPDGLSSKDYLMKLCKEGLYEKYPKEEQADALKRLDYEFSIIESMGFIDYFLIVWDFINFAKQKDIIVGPGRGSAAGALIAYVLDITTVDPLRYGLYFERFLNPERVSMPDIDIDFADHRRDEVMDYVVEKYGRMNVAQVITYGTMSAKAAVRDVGRAMGYPYSEVDGFAKLLPPTVFGKHNPLKDSVIDAQELAIEYKRNPRCKALFDNAIKLEGTIRNCGTHACAVIISDQPLTNFTPLQNASGKEGVIVTQYSMKPLETIGLLKMDFLGLRNLTIIENTLINIKARHNVDINIDNIPLDDEKAYKLLSAGLTTGVFQLESGGMRKYLKELVPSRLEDIIAMNALYRPGPMEYIPQYIAGKHDPSSIKYMHPLFESILKETYGVGVYQEQILEIAKIFAGFSLGQADVLRRAVGKKIPELLEEQKVKFAQGAKDQGHDPKFAEKVFDDVITPFAGYGFNKSHATCYAYISYQTAYLKAHYQTEFMAALMTSDLDNTDRIIIEINECNQLGIEILPPNINESLVDFTATKENEIRFGLGAIKGLGVNLIEKILEERKNGKFLNLTDLCSRLTPDVLNKKSITALAYAGALDEFGNRHQIASNYEILNAYSKSALKSRETGQYSLFGEEEKLADIQLISVPELSNLDMLKKEKEVLGLYVSDHPLAGIKFDSKKFTTISKFSENKKSYSCVAMISGYRKFLTKKGDYMAMFRLEDATSEIESLIFPRNFASLSLNLTDDMIVSVTGTLSIEDSKKLFVNSIREFSFANIIEDKKDDDSMIAFDKDNLTLVINVDSDTPKESLLELKQILSVKGEVSVSMHMIKNNKIVKKLKLRSKIKFDDEVKKNIVELLS